jgi:NADH-quinone oxidoreductase subunit L
VAELAWTIPLWPLLGWLLLGVAGGRLPRPLPGVLASALVGAAFLATVAGAVTYPGAAQARTLFPWIAAGAFRADVALLVDPLALVLALVVTGVGFVIHVYSIGYMADDPRAATYFAYLNLFTAAMLLLVLARNLLVLFVGWELVGLCSYLLIGFWFTRERAAAAGRKAFVVNRIGDAAFLLGVLLLWTQVGTLDLAALNARAQTLDPALVFSAGLLLFAGATGKSAQLPLYTWLPDAMEGPTPVSALIHAATMVTAGVYLVARLYPLFAHPATLAVVGTVGTLTALFAATVALREWDLKRVLAYSTISQLGYMFLALGVLAPSAGIFHLTTHAFFKALLFLAAGSVMHAMHDVIDMRRLGGLWTPLRVTAPAFLVGALALAGVPPFAGFVSKDLILERAWEHALTGGGLPAGLLLAMGVLTAFVTAVYITRAAFYTFAGPLPPDAHPHEAPPVMTVPMGVLALLSVAGGVLGARWAGAPLLAALAPVLERAVPHAAPAHAPPGLLVPALSTVVALAGLATGWWLYRDRREPALGWFGRAAEQHWGLLPLYDDLLVPAARRAALLLAGPVDQGVVDRAVNAVGGAAVAVAGALRRLQTGYVRQYALLLLAGTILVMAYWVVR